MSSIEEHDDSEQGNLDQIPSSYRRHIERFDQLASNERVTLLDILKQFYGRLFKLSVWFLAGFAVFFALWNTLSSEKMLLFWWYVGPEMLLLFVFSASVVVCGLCLFTYPGELGWQKDLDLSNHLLMDAYEYYQQHLGEDLPINQANRMKHAGVTGGLCILHLIVLAILFPPPALVSLI